MTRRELREQNFNLLFETEFYPPEKLEEQLDIYMADLAENTEKVSKQDIDYIRTKFLNLVSKIEEIDARINEVAEKWTTKRMGKVELTILRLAYYEMNYEDEIPVSVAINEAVELAKKFGRDESPAFVNGVLAKLV